MKTLLANLKHAACNSESVSIGGGMFSPADIREAVGQIVNVVSVLNEIVGQEKPNQYGYDAVVVAFDDAWRERARRALAEAKGV